MNRLRVEAAVISIIFLSSAFVLLPCMRANAAVNPVSIAPFSVTLDVGQSQLFNITASSVIPLGFQWYQIQYRDIGHTIMVLFPLAVPGATEANMTYHANSAGYYGLYLNVTDSKTTYAVSNTVYVTVHPVPSVSILPASVTLDFGYSQLFTSTVSGGWSPYSYQWYIDGALFSGATNATWMFIPTSSGSYTVYQKVTDAVNTVATSNTANVFVNGTLSVTILPSTSVALDAGQVQLFNSTVSGGTLPYTYQWYLNDTAFLGAIDSTWTFNQTSAGFYRVYVNVTDGAGAQTLSSTVTVTVSAQPLSPIWYIILAAVVVAAIVVGLAVYKKLKRPKKPPIPAKLRITAEPLSIIANGESKSTITLQLLDKKGKPIPAIADTQVKIGAARGKLENPMVTIPKGKDTEKTVIVSTTQSGQVPVVANAEGLKSISITLNFEERKRYCMHCGAVMPITSSTCPNCGKVPPAGVDTKVCQNCSSVIPSIAKFCSECGAGQKA